MKNLRYSVLGDKTLGTIKKGKGRKAARGGGQLASVDYHLD